MSENRRKHAKPIVVALFTKTEAQALNFKHALTQTLRLHLSKSRTPGASFMFKHLKKASLLHFVQRSIATPVFLIVTGFLMVMRHVVCQLAALNPQRRVYLLVGLPFLACFSRVCALLLACFCVFTCLCCIFRVFLCWCAISRLFALIKWLLGYQGS